MINNVQPFVNGTMHSYCNIVVRLFDEDFAGVTAIEYNENMDITPLYGAGNQVLGYGFGNINLTGTITMYMESVRAIERATPNGKLFEIPPFPINITYVTNLGDLHTDVLHNCVFKSNGRSWTQNQMGQEVPLELIFSHIEKK